MRVSSKEHKESRSDRILKIIEGVIYSDKDPVEIVDLIIEAYPDSLSKKEKDNRTIIPSPNDSIVLCMLRSEAVALATALDSLSDEYKRTKALAEALREQKIV